MKKLLLLLLAAALPLTTQAAPRAVSMDIYSNGALVIFELDAAEDMTFQLPGAFDLNSVKAIIPADMTLTYFQKASVPASDSVPDSLKGLHAAVKTKETEALTLSARIEAAKSSLDLITNLSNNEGTISAADLSEFAKSLLDLYSASNVDINLLGQQYKEVKKDLDKLRRLYQQRLPHNYEYLVDVNMGVTGKGKIRVEAFSSAASWTPSYTMNLDSKTGQVRSVFKANAHQRTGLTYSGDITFYTQTPPRGAISVPKPFPMVVDFVPEESPIPAAPKIMRNQMAEEAKMVADRDYAPAQEPMVMESLTNFAIKGKGRLTGDGSTVSVALGETRYQGKLRTILYRNFSREGHLIVTLEKIAGPLLPGTAELTVDGQSSGRTQIANYGRGEDVEIPFGYMPLIKVNKTDNVSRTGSGGLFSSGTVQDGYMLEVVNGSNMQTDIELIDRIPFSANDKITVDSISITPAPDINKENVLTWKMTLKPGESRKFNVSYRVKHPSDKDIYYR